MLNFTKNLVHQSGKVPRKYWGNLTNVKYKSPRNKLTVADTATQKFLVDRIRKKYPDHSIMAEESGKIINPGKQFLWVIDPIDGTAAFAKGLPWFGTSIGIFKDNKPYLGVVYDPIIDELFWAQKNKGAYLNGKKIKPSKVDNLKQVNASIGFPWQRRSALGQKQLKNFNNLNDKLENLFIAVCAVTSFCYVACGRLDAYFEYILYPWDFAGATIIVDEAGGKVTTPEGKPWSLKSTRLVATNGKIHDKLLKKLVK